MPSDGATPGRRRLVAARAVQHPGGGEAVVRPAVIDLQGSLITAVHDGGVTDAPPVPPGTPTDVLGPRWLVAPAFIDGHTHLALSALRGLALPAAADHNLVEAFFYRIERAMTPEDVRSFVRMGAYEALISGTGLVWEHYYRGTYVADALEDVGLAGVVAPTLQDLAGPGVGRAERALETTLEIAGDARRRRRGIYAAFGPHATDTVSRELFGRVAALAETHHLPVHCHVAQSLDELERVAAREQTTPTGLLAECGVLDAAPRSLLVHNVLSTAADLALLDPARTALALCPHSKEIFAFIPDVRAWEERGLPWIVGTDCAASNDGLAVQRDLRAVAGLRPMAVSFSATRQRFFDDGGLRAAREVWELRTAERERTPYLAPESTLLDRVWRVPGSLHPAFTAGTLAAGALANIALWDLEHPTFWPSRAPLRALALAQPGGGLGQMMVAGRWLGDRGDFARSIVGSDAYRQAREEASARLATVEARIR